MALAPAFTVLSTPVEPSRPVPAAGVHNAQGSGSHAGVGALSLAAGLVGAAQGRRARRATNVRKVQEPLG